MACSKFLFSIALTYNSADLKSNVKFALTERIVIINTAIDKLSQRFLEIIYYDRIILLKLIKIPNAADHIFNLGFREMLVNGEGNQRLTLSFRPGKISFSEGRILIE